MSEYILTAQTEIRIDSFLSQNIESLTRAAAANLIESGNCKVNGTAVTVKKRVVRLNDEIVLNIPESKPADILPENIPLDVRYDDGDVIVVNKPRGMVVHPAVGNYTGTLVNALTFRCGKSLSGINGVVRPGIVHRLDKDTSGLIIAAKNDSAHLNLAQQLKSRTMSREYEAVVCGRLKNLSGTIDAPIGRSVFDRKKMCVTSKNSRAAVTHYEVVGYYDKFTHVRLKLHTGRTHQIRVHMAYIGHSVAGDLAYGSKKPALGGGQCLHAKRLSFIHPKTGERIEIESELPDYFTEFLERLKFYE